MINAFSFGATARLLKADYEHLYGGRSEGCAKQAGRAVPRFASNPSLHAVVLMRLADSRVASRMARRLLMRRHAIYLDDGVVLGPGLILPHPFGIVLGSRVTLGSNVMLYHNITVGTLGTDESAQTIIGDGAIVHTNAFIARGVTIGAGAVIGANSCVEEDVPDRAMVSRGRVRELADV